MGWNVATPSIQNHLTADVGNEPRYYFVHSYCVHVDDPEHSLMRSHYGIDFDSAIGRGNICGVQVLILKKPPLWHENSHQLCCTVTMLRTRIIPALLLRNESLVKTVRFGNFTYVSATLPILCAFSTNWKWTNCCFSYHRLARKAQT